MTEPNLFWIVFAAVMSANLLTVCFVWGMVTYSRHERDGTAGGKGSHFPALAILMPLLFVAMGVMTALDKVPAWLDAMAK